MPSSLNGTGVTFNDNSTLQSGNIPTGNMGSGTANSSTFLRGDRTWSALPAPVIADGSVTTAKIANGAVTPAKILPPTAGNNVLHSIQTAGDSTNNINFPAVGVRTGFLVRVLVSGVIRCNYQHRSQFTSRQSIARVLRNGSQVQQFSTNSTSFVTRNTDVTVNTGDLIEIQHRSSGSDNVSVLQNVRILSGNITLAVA